ncbi:hypothetical protein [Paenibacillus marinisediminis]
MSVVFSLVTTGLFVITGICSVIVINHHRRVQSWHAQRNASDLS